MSIKVSVVIPTFKRPQLLVRCLTALTEQSFLPGDFEIIVVTDGPDEITKTAVTDFIGKHPLITVLCAGLSQKAGPAAARNRGVGFASGELIAFTDDDCIPQKDWLKCLWNAYEDQKLKEIAFTGSTIVPYTGKPTDYEKNTAHLENAEFITANCACTRDAFEKAGGFDEEFAMAWREDSELQFKFIAVSVPVVKITQALVVHPVRKAPWGISLKEQEKGKYNALLHKKHPTLYKQKIGARPLYNYYGIVILLPVAIISGFFQKPALTAIIISLWILLITRFIIKRLKGTTKRAGHVVEIIATSILIPYLSVFWTLYGSFRYKKLLL